MRKLIKPFFSKKIFGILFFVIQLVILAMPAMGLYDSYNILNQQRKRLGI